MSRFRKYSFWVALVGAIILVIESFGKVFGFAIDSPAFESIVLSICGVFVVLGLIEKDSSDSDNEDDEEDDN